MEEYRVVLESQLGPREGDLQFEEKDGSITGAITLLGYRNAASGERTGAHSLRLAHHLHTLVSDLACVSLFEIEGDRITGTLRNNHNTMRWHGERVTKPQGGVGRNAGES